MLRDWVIRKVAFETFRNTNGLMVSTGKVSGGIIIIYLKFKLNTFYPDRPPPANTASTHPSLHPVPPRHQQLRRVSHGPGRSSSRRCLRMGRTFLNLQHRQLFVYFCSQHQTNLKLFSIDNFIYRNYLFIRALFWLLKTPLFNVNTTVGDPPTPEAPTILHNKNSFQYTKLWHVVFHVMF